MSSDRLLLLDTHVWIWALENIAAKLSRAAVDEIEQAAEDGRIAISPISVWEVGMLEVRQRITLSRTIHEWVTDALSVPGTRYVDVSPTIALESTRLPGKLHGDPADRILIATARELSATLVTCDARIVRYASAGHVLVHDGRPRRIRR